MGNIRLQKFKKTDQMHLSCQSVKTLDRFDCLGNLLRLSELYWCPGLQFYSKERPILNYPIEVKTIIVIK